MLNVFVLGPLRKGYIYGLHAACTRRFPRRQRTRSRYNTGKAPKRNPVQALIGRVPGHRGDDSLHAVIARIFAPIFFLYRQLSYAQHSFDLNHGVLRVRRHGGDNCPEPASVDHRKAVAFVIGSDVPQSIEAMGLQLRILGISSHCIDDSLDCAGLGEGVG